MATISTAKAKYKIKIESARREDKFTKGMAQFFGVSPDRIRDAPPVRKWNTFDIDAAADNWEKGLKAAFGLE